MRWSKPTGWARDHARGRSAKPEPVMAPGECPPRPCPQKHSRDALVVLQEVWQLSGEPCGKYLSIMADTLERLVRFKELGRLTTG